MKSFDSRWLVAGISSLAITCASEAPDAVPTDGETTRVVQEFVGHYDADTGSITIDMIGSSFNGLDPANIVQDGVGGGRPRRVPRARHRVDRR